VRGETSIEEIESLAFAEVFHRMGIKAYLGTF
jgi:hypothetical protein